MEVKRTPRPVTAGTLATEVGLARMAAGIVAIGTVLSSVLLYRYRSIGLDGSPSRPFLGHAIAVLAIGVGLAMTLILLAAWVEAWRTERLASRSD